MLEQPDPPQNIYWTCAQVSSTWHERMSQNSANTLSQKEASKLASFRFKKRREEWLSGRLAVKHLVQQNNQHLLLPEIVVENEPSGSPYLTINGTRIPDSISLSHSGIYTCIACTNLTQLTIGIDCEKIEPRAEAFVLDYFTQSEVALIHQAPSEQHPRLVTLIWSLKESILKALKTGLHRDTRQVEVTPGNELVTTNHVWHPALARDLQNTQLKFFAWWQVRDEYVITLAVLVSPEFDGHPPVLVEKQLPFLSS